MNQLHSYAHAAIGVEDRPFENSVDPEFASDVFQGAMHSFKLHHGRSGNHAQPFDSGQLRNQFVRHAIRQIILSRISREVFQRQNSDGVDTSGPACEVGITDSAEENYRGQQQRRQADHDQQNNLDVARPFSTFLQSRNACGLDSAVIRSIEDSNVGGRAAKCINFDTHLGVGIQANQMCVDAERGTLLRWRVGDELIENSDFFQISTL